MELDLQEVEGGAGPMGPLTTSPSTKRKRPEPSEDGIDDDPIPPLQKRKKKPLRPSGTSTQIGNVQHWLEKGTWPREYFQPAIKATRRFLARQKSVPSLPPQQSQTGPITGLPSTPSDQKSREVKSKPYQNILYGSLLATKHSYMGESELGIDDESKKLCRQLLEAPQPVPQDSLFNDNLFASTCRAVRDRNEARLIRDIAPLLVPSAENLAICDETIPNVLIESIDEGWRNSEPLTLPCPQPDYSLGFRRDAFTIGQLAKLSPHIGDYVRGDHSHFMGTRLIMFPFFCCEVMCGAGALEIADRKNAHSMTMAVRGIVTLFTLANRQQELHRKVLAFSVSHDHQSVRIYGHYPIITDEDTSFYRHCIAAFDFTELDGQEKWTTYQFTKNVYQKWLPTHLENIRSAIDDIPGLEDPQLPKKSGLSQCMENHRLS